MKSLQLIPGEMEVKSKDKYTRKSLHSGAHQLTFVKNQASTNHRLESSLRAQKSGSVNPPILLTKWHQLILPTETSSRAWKAESTWRGMTRLMGMQKLSQKSKVESIQWNRQIKENEKIHKNSMDKVVDTTNYNLLSTDMLMEKQSRREKELREIKRLELLYSELEAVVLA